MTYKPILIYTNPVLETTGTRFGDWKQINRRMYRPYLAVFLRPYACVLILWVDVSGDTFGYAGSLFCRFANPVNCPPALFGDREAGYTTHKKGAAHG